MKRISWNSVYWGAACAVLLSYVIYLYLIVNYIPVGADAGIFLSLGRYLNEGKIIYHEVFSWYAPFGFYNYALIYRFIDHASFEHMIVLQAVYLILSAIVLARTVFELVNRNVAFSFLAASIYLMCAQHFLRDIKLEAFCVFFISVSWYSFLKGNHEKEKKRGWHLACGVACGFLFLTKQYGLLFLPVYLSLSIIIFRSLRNAFFIAIGFGIPIALFLIFYTVQLVNHNAELLDGFTSLLQVFGVSKNACGTEIISYGEHRWMNIAMGGTRYIYLFIPVVFLILLLMLFKRFAVSRREDFIPFLLGLFGLMPLYFVIYPHYFLFSFYFFFFGAVSFFHYHLRLAPIPLKALFFLLALIPLLKVEYSQFLLEKYFRPLKANQVAIHKELKGNCPEVAPGKMIYFDTYKYLWTFADYRSVNPKQIGFTFLYDDCLVESINLFESGSLLMTNKDLSQREDMRLINDFMLNGNPMKVYEKR